ncbi:NADH dehydrogenase [ubiquinone] 1 beta subcomplex subunit 2, mitochondrial-like [Arctopsyche grandis]|uniref:NADH dehydrogenase [ubiquinone] 1 beta subcomplex subunit 2, mitochondrial-like n=1 Tax=Arctopsyche grandis TaxID=121162 RepID=UPI00406D8749
MQGAARAVGCGGLRRLLAKSALKPAVSSGAGTGTGTTIAIRNHGTWSYRTAPALPAATNRYVASAMGGIMWWWILWHLWTEPEHLTGEFPRVYPELWTDEELGIPPDSEGIGGRTQVYY